MHQCIVGSFLNLKHGYRHEKEMETYCFKTVHIVGPEMTWLIKLIRWKQLSHLSVHGPDLVLFFADATFLYWYPIQGRLRYLYIG